MLLVDKNANRVSRQKNEDVTATLTLPLLLLQEHPVPVRLKVRRLPFINVLLVSNEHPGLQRPSG
jgi:hypothetical protein